MSLSNWMSIVYVVFGCYVIWVASKGYKSGKIEYGKTRSEVTRISDPAKYWTQVIGLFVIGLGSIFMAFGVLLGLIPPIS